MNLEGLDYVLNKKEVVPTVSASDLLERPEQVEADYRRHVRTYVPISRATAGADGQLSVQDFEQRVISRIKGAKAPRGYLTAEYGYGKTSTALYLWARAEEEGLVVVPPFQMQRLIDLVTATHGWLRYRLDNRQPGLVARVDDLYQATTNLSIEQAAREVQGSESVMRRWVKEGRFAIDLQTADYIHYFEEATDIAKEAGYQGLLVLPDEIQQYVEPQLISGAGDPIAPFFNLVQGLATREGHLCFGFIMVIPRKEIGVIREARGRGDLLDRMREVSLDLSSVYDHGFARRLWERLAKEFGFAQVASQIVCSETLDAVGEIASREDLSNGPRTVVNVFSRMVRRYLETGGAARSPYTPIHLVDDLLQGEIPYSGNDQIQNVTRRALQSALVNADSERLGPAVKLAAAFPSDGVPTAIQRQYGVAEALDELKHAALGDLVIAVGPIEENGITLLGLQRGQQTVEWLPLTIRDFRRAYSESHDDTRERAIEVFEHILETRVFAGWKVTERRESSYTSNRGVIFQGDFPSFASRFPNRKVHARLLWEDEEDKDGCTLGDVLLEYRLSLHRDVDPDERRDLALPATLAMDEHRAYIPINLLHVRPEGVADQIRASLEGVWSPYDLSPLVLMGIYQMLDEKRERGLVPRRDDQFIKEGFQPDLLDNIVRDLFCPEVGAQFDAAGERINDLLVEQLLEARYGATYSTLMLAGTWKSSLQKYVGALERLENRYQRGGAVTFEGTKKEVADLMTLSNTGLDSFMRTFGCLLSQESDWPSQKQAEEGDRGAVKFSLHPQEVTILKWLRESPKRRDVNLNGMSDQVHCLELGPVYEQSQEMGYQREEVEQLVQLLERRGLVEVHQHTLLCEVPLQGPPVQTALSLLRELGTDLETLAEGFPDDNRLVTMRSHTELWQQSLETQLTSQTPDAELVYSLTKNVRLRQEEVRDLAQNKRRAAMAQVSTMLRGLRQVSAQQLDQPGKSIEGTVSYVDLVNRLRMALYRHAQSVHSSVDGFRFSLERSLTVLGTEDLLHRDLVAQVAHIREYDGQQVALKERVEDADAYCQHLTGWIRLVRVGSELFATLGQMEHSAREQAQSFDDLCRDIRGDITSSENLLEMLQNYSVYEARLNDVVAQVQCIREKAIDEFSGRQGDYRLRLESSGLYRRDQLWQPFEFNFSNPGESTRLLETQVSQHLVTACDQMDKRAVSYRSEVQNILSTPYLKDLNEEDKTRVMADGKGLLMRTQRLLKDLVSSKEEGSDRSAIADLSPDNEGRFDVLMKGLIDAKDTLRELDREVRDLGEWLRQFDLSPEQQEMLESLSDDGTSGSHDLIEWRNRLPHFSDDQFWTNLQGLYNNRRISVSVSQVRV